MVVLGYSACILLVYSIFYLINRGSCILSVLAFVFQILVVLTQEALRVCEKKNISKIAVKEV